MSAMFIYMVKAAVYLAAFYLVYSLMLSRDTTYSRNRAFILLSLTSSFFLPLITFHFVKPLDIQFFGKFLSEVLIIGNRSQSAGSEALQSSAGPLQIIFTVYIIGVIVCLFKFLIDFSNLIFLIARKRNKGSRIIRFHGFNTAGFSALGYIFINTRLSPEEAGQIIKHEQNHLRQNHFLDIIFLEMVITFQWFNPVAYLFNRALRAIHEFQADQDCLSSGVTMVSYQSLLLSQVFKSKAFNLTNSFSNPSLIKRRMVMMTKKRTSSFANMKLLLVLPITGIVFLAISAYTEIPNPLTTQVLPVTLPDSFSDLSVNPSSSFPLSALNQYLSKASLKKSSVDAKKSEEVPPPPPPPPSSSDVNTDLTEKLISEEEVPFVVVEEMPLFPGGPNELLKFIASETNYPEAAKNNNIEGKVIIRFCVTAKGGVSMASVLKGVSPELDKEALRVVNSLPTFIPGKQGGKPVPVWYMVPIAFTLR
jgi:TonB family protein